MIGFALCLLPLQAAAADDKAPCIYKNERGEALIVASIEDVPAPYKAVARCMKSEERMAQPKEIELRGNIRREQVTSPLGQIELRWPRPVERLFGRTPLRATIEAARTVDRAITGHGFPTELGNTNLQWQIVFMDQKMPEKQIPSYLQESCHPGWMTPPSNIYIVAQRVAGACNGAAPVKGSVADSELSRVLVHEMGHAIDYRLIKLTGGSDTDRMRAEGFATWFEQYAAGYSSLINASSLKRQYHSIAASAIQANPRQFQFAGTAGDYTRASLYFEAIVAKRGVRGIVDVYETMAKGLSFTQAIQKTMGWNAARLEQEIQKIVQQ